MSTDNRGQSNPWHNQRSSRCWREPEHMTSPAAIDRRADFLSGLGRVADAERLSDLAETLRQGAAQ